MGQKYTELLESHVQFIGDQHIFFVGTATADSRVNISPKGMDSFRVIDKKRVVWLNVTGSGNETSAHVQNNPRMTIMFCSFDEKPLILRLYGSATVVHQGDKEWSNLYSLFKPIPGSRQIFDLKIDLIQTSCGMAVPYYKYSGDRDSLIKWANNKGKDGLDQYWETKNQKSIDGISTFIIEKSINQ